MYIPPKYRNSNLDEVRSFVQDNAFGILISKGLTFPLATHIPLEIDKDEDGSDILVGHVAKANPHWKTFETQSKVLAIFNGPHTYISSSWYQEEEVPTWNYIAVHIKGTLKVLPEEAVLASLHKLVNKYEKDSENPLNLNDLSPKTMRQIKGIVGFKITIEKIHAAYKLSQGREADHPKIMEELRKR
ncbi:MAG: FMN-binding negative transcriptional regulator, partial [Flavobacteriaceae bacterium]|nr:FMN-binding negative transcriptional regulator [Flavobacteriaceae bacterium]